MKHKSHSLGTRTKIHRHARALKNNMCCLFGFLLRCYQQDVSEVLGRVGYALRVVGLCLSYMAIGLLTSMVCTKWFVKRSHIIARSPQDDGPVCVSPRWLQSCQSQPNTGESVRMHDCSLTLSVLFCSLQHIHTDAQTQGFAEKSEGLKSPETPLHTILTTYYHGICLVLRYVLLFILSCLLENASEATLCKHLFQIKFSYRSANKMGVSNTSRPIVFF